MSQAGPDRTGRSWTLPLALLPAAVALVVLPPSSDGLDDVKLLGVAVAVAIAGWRAVGQGDRRTALRRLDPPARTVLAAFLLAAGWATLRSDQPLQSLLGAHERHNGLLTYALLSVLLVQAATLLPIRRIAQCAQALAVGTAVSVAYWLVQLAGWDPLRLAPPPDAYSRPNPFTSTLGNPNFAGAFAAAALPAALWAATRPGLRPRARLGWLAAVGLAAMGVAGADSLQAPIAAAAGTGAFAVAWLAPRHRRAAAAALLAGVLLAAVAGLGLLRAGPLAGLGAQETFAYRTWDWTTAVRMARDHPLTGVGLARYGAHMRAYRPSDQVDAYGWQLYDDTPHSVPLDMAAGGGVPLLAAYLALVGLTGTRLVRGLFRLDGERQALLGAFGGVWTAYHTQSLVSIDVVRLSTLHFLAAGAILALTAASARDALVLPARRASAPLRAAAAAFTVLPVLWLTGQATAELLLGLSMAREDHDRPAALRAANWSTRAFPWRPPYWAQLGAVLEDTDAPDQALDAYLHAVRLDPREVFLLLTAAETAHDLGQIELAAALLRRATRAEPRAADIHVMAAHVVLQLGHTAEALRLLDAALALDPEHADAQQLRATIRVSSPRGRRR